MSRVPPIIGGGAVAINTAAPTITGTRGSTLTAHAGTWTGSTSVSGQWYADGTATGNTTTSYSDTDATQTIEYRETALPGSVTASAWDGAVPNATAMTFNPADKTSGCTLSNGNLTADNFTSPVESVRTTAAFTSGKHYFESHIDLVGSNQAICLADSSWVLSGWPGQSNAHGFSFNSQGDGWFNGNFGTGSSFTTGDVMAIAVDADNKKAWVLKNGVSITGNPSTGTGGYALTGMGSTIYPTWAGQSGHQTATYNFGATAFAYTPPTGFSGASGVTVLGAVNPQSSGAVGKQQIDITATSTVSGTTGMQYKVETSTGVLVQGWTNMTYSAGSASATYTIADFAYQATTFKVFARNVGGTVQVAASTTNASALYLQQSMKIGLNDGFWDYWSSQVPGRDIFEFVTLHPSENMHIRNQATGQSHFNGMLPPGLDFPTYAHWNETYNPAQLYPATSTPGDDNYLVCVYNGVMWRRTSQTPRSGVAPDPADSAGTTSGWQRYYFSAGSLVGLKADGWPSQHPSDTNLQIAIYVPSNGFKESHYPFTVHCKTEPGVVMTSTNGSVTMTNVNLAAGTFDLNYTGDSTTYLLLDRSTPISSAFFISGVATFETGAPAQDIGHPYVNVDKLSDFAPFYAMRNMSAALTNHSTDEVINGRTAANSVPSGGLRLWKYNVDMANSNNHPAIWVNVDSSCDSTYIDAMASYYLANLNPGITVYLELSNERWNGAFHQATNLQDRAVANGITNRQQHSREHKAMVTRWRTIWGGSTSRIKAVLAWQGVATISDWQEMLDFESGYQAVDVVAKATYFNWTNLRSAGQDVGDYTNTPTAVRNAVSANDYAAFETACDAVMRTAADYMVTLAKELFDWIPTYSVSKGLSKDAIGTASYEGGPEIIVNQGNWDAGLGAGMGARVLGFVQTYKRSAAMGATYAYYLDKLATQCPHLFMAFDYQGPADGWGHMSREGHPTDEPYATLKTKALTYN
jgi:hypothetical protein